MTLNRLLPGPDHICSQDPQGFKSLVISIRETEKCLGNGIKAPTESERSNMLGMRRSLVAKRDITIGEIAKVSDFTLQRPSTGLPPAVLHKLIDRPYLKNKEAGDFFHWSDFEENANDSKINT